MDDIIFCLNSVRLHNQFLGQTAWEWDDHHHHNNNNMVKCGHNEVMTDHLFRNQH